MAFVTWDGVFSDVDTFKFFFFFFFFIVCVNVEDLYADFVGWQWLFFTSFIYLFLNIYNKKNKIL